MFFDTDLLSMIAVSKNIELCGPKKTDPSCKHPKVLSNMPNFPVFLLNFPLLFFLGGSAQTHFHYVPYIEFMTSQMSFMSRYLWTHPLISTIEI